MASVNGRLAILLSFVVTLASCGPRTGLGPTDASGSPSMTASATTSVSGAAPDLTRPLSAEGLRAAIEAERESADPWRDVVYEGGIDATRKPPPIERECAELTPCTVIGTLDSFDDLSGVVTVAHRAPDVNLPPPTAADDVAGPVGLHISRTGPIEFLGHVELAGGGIVGSVADVAQAATSLRNGVVRAVDGWLTTVNTTCGPAPMPLDPPLPHPFNCNPPGWIGSDSNGDPPMIDVQTFAYLEFASDPARPGDVAAQFPARRGIYLVRWVEYEAANCHDCRRYLVVGRLDASTPSPNDRSNAPAIRSAQELALALAADRRALIDHVVFVDGQILPGRAAGGCSGNATCSIGTLIGAAEPVRATPYTVSLLLPDTDFPTHGVLSLVVRPDGLEYLGHLGLNDGVDRSVIYPIPLLLDPQTFSRGPLTVIAHGWLIDAWLPCPTTPGPPGPPDLPFGPCATDWLTPSAESIPTAPASGSEGLAPRDGLRVQTGAYQTFAANARNEPGVGDVPQEGTYLLREAQDRPDQPDTRRGWQVVARLGP